MNGMLRREIEDLDESCADYRDRLHVQEIKLDAKRRRACISLGIRRVTECVIANDSSDRGAAGRTAAA
jgi:hypothetical protein